MGGINQLLGLALLAAAIGTGLKAKDFISESFDQR